MQKITSGISALRRVKPFIAERGQGRREGGGAKYLGPGLVRGPEILIKHLVIVLLSRGLGGPIMRNHMLVLGPDHGFRRP